jgi:hypothetical protein
MRNFITFLKNIWAFRKALWKFRWWDYNFTLEMMKTSLQIMSDNLETKGIEVDGPRMKKVDKMRRAIEIMNNMNNVHHIEMAEKELGKLFIDQKQVTDSVCIICNEDIMNNLKIKKSLFLIIMVIFRFFLTLENEGQCIMCKK